MISFNLNELEKIYKGISRNPKTRELISNELNELYPKVQKAKNLDSKEEFNEIKGLARTYSERRRKAIALGANSIKDPRWVVPAVCESWLHGLMFDNEESKEKIEEQINLLRSNESQSLEKRPNDYFGWVVMFVGGPMGYIVYGWIGAIIVIIIGLIIVGWPDRHKGPFPTN